MSKEELLAFLKTKGALEKVIVCREEHKDGTPHLHSFAKYANRVHVTRQDFFNHQGYHPNMLIAKSYRAVSTYVKKSGDFIEEGMDSEQEL